MKVKELRDILHNLDQEAEVLLHQLDDAPGAKCIEIQDCSKTHGYILLCASDELFD